MVTYVPGTFAKLGSIDGDIGRAVALQSEAERHDLAHSTASVVWLGYDAPQAIMSDATETEWADKAEEPLGNFLQGIEEANHRDVNQTLLGHSYGSLVAGQTMSTHIDLPVDNAIMVGSPGVGVDHAKDLNIPADHVFAATAKNDLINLAPPLAGPWPPQSEGVHGAFRRPLDRSRNRPGLRRLRRRGLRRPRREAPGLWWRNYARALPVLGRNQSTSWQGSLPEDSHDSAGAFPAAALLAAMTVMVTACGAQQDSGETPKQVMMNEQQAMDRAEEIVHQAVDGMSPNPTLERTGPETVGPCIARDDHGPDDRLQVTLFYKLTGVPGSEAKSLVLQARDAWLKQGYKYNSSNKEDMSGPFPWVSMRTEPDDFWMEGITGVLDRTKGEGLATLKVRSPCFLPPGKSSASTEADPAALEEPQADDPARHRALGHSSRIYDALRVGSAPTQPGEGLGVVRDESGASVHHAWSTEPLPEDVRVRVLARAQAYFQRAGWSVRHVPTREGAPVVVARHPEEGTIAQVAASTTGAVRVAVTTPADGPTAADV